MCKTHNNIRWHDLLKLGNLPSITQKIQKGEDPGK
jgi:hypothetical protein